MDGVDGVECVDGAKCADREVSLSAASLSRERCRDKS